MLLPLEEFLTSATSLCTISCTRVHICTQLLSASAWLSRIIQLCAPVLKPSLCHSAGCPLHLLQLKLCDVVTAVQAIPMEVLQWP